MKFAPKLLPIAGRVGDEERFARRLQLNKAEPDVLAEQRRQVEDALDRLAIAETSLVRYPYRALDRALGPLAPGDVAIVAAASGAGKTNFAVDVTEKWVAQGKTVVIAMLEINAGEARLHFAARAAGKHPGTVLSFADRPPTDRECAETNWGVDIAVALSKQDATRLVFAEHSTLDAAAVRDIGLLAETVRADVVVFDHLDHVSETDSKSAIAVSMGALSAVHNLAKDLGVVVLGTSQLNQADKAGDRFRNFRGVLEHHIKYGGKKQEIASHVLGLYRPLSQTATKDDRRKVEEGFADYDTVLESNVVALNVIKCRARGDAAGKRFKLRWHRGRLSDWEAGL